MQTHQVETDRIFKIIFFVPFYFYIFIIKRNFKKNDDFFVIKIIKRENKIK